MSHPRRAESAPIALCAVTLLFCSAALSAEPPSLPSRQEVAAAQVIAGPGYRIEKRPPNVTASAAAPAFSRTLSGLRTDGPLGRSL